MFSPRMFHEHLEEALCDTPAMEFFHVDCERSAERFPDLSSLRNTRDVVRLCRVSPNWSVRPQRQGGRKSKYHGNSMFVSFRHDA